MSSSRTNGFKEEDVVFGLVTGYPWWPGFISEKKSKRQYVVTFFGDFSYSPLPEKNIKKFKDGLNKIDKSNEELQLAIESAGRVFDKKSSIEDEHSKVLKFKRKMSRNKMKNKKKKKILKKVSTKKNDLNMSLPEKKIRDQIKQRKKKVKERSVYKNKSMVFGNENNSDDEKSIPEKILEEEEMNVDKKDKDDIKEKYKNKEENKNTDKDNQKKAEKLKKAKEDDKNMKEKKKTKDDKGKRIDKDKKSPKKLKGNNSKKRKSIAEKISKSKSPKKIDSIKSEQEKEQKKDKKEKKKKTKNRSLKEEKNEHQKIENIIIEEQNNENENQKIEIEKNDNENLDDNQINDLEKLQIDQIKESPQKEIKNIESQIKEVEKNNVHFEERIKELDEVSSIQRENDEDFNINENTIGSIYQEKEFMQPSNKIKSNEFSHFEKSINSIYINMQKEDSITNIEQTLREWMNNISKVEQFSDIMRTNIGETITQMRNICIEKMKQKNIYTNIFSDIEDLKRLIMSRITQNFFKQEIVYEEPIEFSSIITTKRNENFELLKKSMHIASQMNNSSNLNLHSNKVNETIRRRISKKISKRISKIQSHIKISKHTSLSLGKKIEKIIADNSSNEISYKNNVIAFFTLIDENPTKFIQKFILQEENKCDIFVMKELVKNFINSKNEQIIFFN